MWCQVKRIYKDWASTKKSNFLTITLQYSPDACIHTSREKSNCCEIHLNLALGKTVTNYDTSLNSVFLLCCYAASHKIAVVFPARLHSCYPITVMRKVRQEWHVPLQFRTAQVGHMFHLFSNNDETLGGLTWMVVCVSDSFYQCRN